ncbi:UvrD-helicase domain-containing protein [candidate division KSB1 bacterium]|nr:UvrD-helicase domain-containing protein [candidate division KSB1 bacterium]
MRFFADLHIHSHFSRATSKHLTPEHLYKWAQIKGLSVVGTGDLTHPKWLEEISSHLEQADNGLYKLKSEFVQKVQREVPGSCRSDVFFLLSGEISSIYKKGDRVRKVHNVVFLSSLEAVSRFQNALDRIGNIYSDGRPILGLDSRDLLEILLESDPDAHLIPAHIWTPWFSLLGSKSGFDTVEECFDDLSSFIFAVETGLSSDPPMNWRLSMLDKYVLVSNSDAHSPEKLAREANIFHTQPGYISIFNALKNRDEKSFWGTIEFYPEEGKYHMDGHRKCQIMMRPAETLQNKGICPVCGKPVTLGVSYRVAELADRPEGFRPSDAKEFQSLIPLPEVLAEVKSVGPNSKTVQTLYHNMLSELGPELKILMDLSINDIKSFAGSVVAEAIRRMRSGQVDPQPGYDGEFGVVRIFKPEEKKDIAKQKSLFHFDAIPQKSEPYKVNSPPVRRVAEPKPPIIQPPLPPSSDSDNLNIEQRQAVDHRGGPLIIQAGPGTGKTRTLTHRLAAMIQSGYAKPEKILAVTFTNKAAAEMRDRLTLLLGKGVTDNMSVQTFHAFGLNFLRSQDSFAGRTKHFTVIDAGSDKAFQDEVKDRCGEKLTETMIQRISRLKSDQIYFTEDIPKEIREQCPASLPVLFQAYQDTLVETNSVDFDDLIGLPLQILSKEPQVRRKLLQQYRIIAVDEFQDINRAQYQMFRLLAIAALDVCVIGDPDQAIYGFRGASRDFFLRFTDDFPHAKSLKLVRNYRSAQNILSASIQVLKREPKTESKDLWSHISPDVKVRIYQAPTDRAEAEFIVHRIEQLLGGTSYFSMNSQRVDDRGLPSDYSFSDMAILVRTRRIGPVLQEALARSGMPFEALEASRLTSQKETLFIYDALRLIQNRNVITSQKAVARYFSNENCTVPSFEDIFAEPVHLPEKNDDLLFQQFLKLYYDHPAGRNVIDYIEQFRPFLKNDKTKNTDHMIKTLKELAQPFENNINRFLDMLILHQDIDIMGDRIKIATLHASKGLEFPVVFIPACEDTILPLQQPGLKSDVEEERRLLYVGMTRARRQLFLSYAKTRLVYGKKQSQTPSRFLNPISNSLLMREKSENKVRIRNERQLSLF